MSELIVCDARALVDPRPPADVQYEHVVDLLDRVIAVQDKIVTFLARQHPEAFDGE